MSSTNMTSPDADERSASFNASTTWIRCPIAALQGGDQVRADHKLENRQATLSHNSRHSAFPRRQGDRMRRRVFIALIGRGSSMAGNRARAAGGDAGSRVYQCRFCPELHAAIGMFYR